MSSDVADPEPTEEPTPSPTEEPTPSPTPTPLPAPVISFSSPLSGTTYVNTTSIAVTFSVSAPGGPSTWSVGLQSSDLNSGGHCQGSTEGWDDFGTPVAGSGEVTDHTVNFSAPTGACYRFAVTATNAESVSASDNTNGRFAVDTVAPTVNFDDPGNIGDPRIDWSSDNYTVKFDVNDNHGLASWSLQRQHVLLGDNGGCPGPWGNVSSPTTGTSEGSNQTINHNTATNEACFRWVLTATDQAGNTTSQTSSTIRRNN